MPRSKPSARPTPPQPVQVQPFVPHFFRRFSQEAVLLLSALLLGLWVAALWSYHPQDPAWSTTGLHTQPVNYLGHSGAWLADLSLYLLGHSVWVLIAALAAAWWRLLRRWLRAENTATLRAQQADAVTVGHTLWRWYQGHISWLLGLVLLLAVCCTLEWSRLYHSTAPLPGSAGGVLGASLGVHVTQLLGFSGSGVIGVILFWLLLGWVFRFSWLSVTQWIGSLTDWAFTAIRHAISATGDWIAGYKLARKREREIQQARLRQQQSQQASEPVRKTEPIQPSMAQAAPPPPVITAPPVVSPIPVSQPESTVSPDIHLQDSEKSHIPPLVSWPEPAISTVAPTVQEQVAPVAAPIAPTTTWHPATPPLHVSLTSAWQADHQPPQPEAQEDDAALAFARGASVYGDEDEELTDAQPPQFVLPPMTLLDPAPAGQPGMAQEVLEDTSRLIEQELANYGVSVRVVAAIPGPVITRYEIEPATGVKGSRIVNLAKDLARVLCLSSIRVVETIPGKNLMALELPNPRRQSINLCQVLDSPAFHKQKSMLALGLGMDIVGNPVVADLGKMPHVLVAGTTGSGKSVGINAMILSLLYRATPQDVRLIMVDPKILELSIYEDIPHLLAPVVTDMRQAANALNWCVGEMERRYHLISKLGMRKLVDFNSKIMAAQLRGESIPNPFSLTPDSPEPLEPLPAIVVVIDELADLFMVEGKKIEIPIARLAQKGRAAGIHLILATQRPSVDVVTGLIKANVPTRIAFQVASKHDSVTVLNQMGAEGLLGLGDMLYMPAGTDRPTRLHGAFVSDDEVHRITEFLREQGAPNYIEGILEGGVVDGEDTADGTDADADVERTDPLYDKAVEIVISTRIASASRLQRQLGIGFSRAARLLDQMENAGIVGPQPANSSKRRDILVPARSSRWDE